MSTEKERNIVTFLNDMMCQRKYLSSQLATSLGVSHTTVGRWLSGKYTPSVTSCRKLAKYTGIPLEQILADAGYLPRVARSVSAEWPEFREYAHQKYPHELDEDIITMIEDFIERRRAKSQVNKDS